MNCLQEINRLKQSNGWSIIGISGMTNSGKTTLAKRMQENIQSVTILNQDNYFRLEDDPKHIIVPLDETRFHQNWEMLESVDWDNMWQDIIKLLKQPSKNGKGVLIIEGHIIFLYRSIYDICDKRYFIAMEDKDIIAKRRQARTYIPADPPGYYDGWVWPMYFINKKKLLDQKLFINFLDGRLTKDELYNVVMDDFAR